MTFHIAHVRTSPKIKLHPGKGIVSMDRVNSYKSAIVDCLKSDVL